MKAIRRDSNLHIRIESPLHAALKATARKADKSVSDVVHAILKASLVKPARLSRPR